MLSDSKHCSSPCEREPYLEKAKSPHCQLSRQPGSRLTQQKTRESFSSVLESWSGWWESPESKRASWREWTDWRKRHCSFSIFSWDQFPASTAPAALLEKPFSLSLDCGKSPGKQVFLVLALLSIPHIAYTRIYDSLTKQIAGPIKANPWNSGRVDFHSSTTSVGFNFFSVLVLFCNMSEGTLQGPAAWGLFKLFLLFEDNL